MGFYPFAVLSQFYPFMLPLLSSIALLFFLLCPARPRSLSTRSCFRFISVPFAFPSPFSCPLRPCRTLAQFFRWFWVYPIFKCVVLAFAAITAAILTMNPTDRNAEIEEELKRMNEDDEDLNV